MIQANPIVNAFNLAYDQKPLTNATTQWLAHDKMTGEEITVIFDVIKKCLVTLIDSEGDVYECDDLNRLTSIPPFEYKPDDDCASEWEKKYLSDYLTFHKQVVGPVGTDGVVGITGPVGDEGQIGKTGVRGVIGDQGPVGPDGAMGPPGAPGQAGSAGICTCPGGAVSGTLDGSTTTNACPATVITSGFGTGPDGSLVVPPGGSGSIRVEYNSCRFGSAIAITWARNFEYPPCGGNGNGLSGSPGAYYGNLYNTSGAFVVTVDNPTSETCGIGPIQAVISYLG